MWLRDERGDVFGTARGLAFGCLLGLICWAMVFLAVVAVWPVVKMIWRAL